MAIKLVTPEAWNAIQKAKGLIPLSKPINGIQGNWAIPDENMEKWEEKVPYFGSALQALALKSTGNSLVVLRLPESPHAYERNLDLIFKHGRIRDYRASFKPAVVKPDYIQEILLTEEISIKQIQYLTICHVPKWVKLKTIENPHDILTGRELQPGKTVHPRIGFLVLISKMFGPKAKPPDLV